MTEKEWEKSSDRDALLSFLYHQRHKPSARKLRLFAVACCQRISDLFTGRSLPRAIDTAEKFADGTASTEELKTACLGAVRAMEAASRGVVFNDFIGPRFHAVAKAVAMAAANTESFYPLPRASRDSDWVCSASQAAILAAAARANKRPKGIAAERVFQTSILRDIIGPLPFRRVRVAQGVLGSQAKALAQEIYDDLAFDRLPALADALEEAGCANAELLAHLRGLGPHVRGCWALDLVLGKE